ncbi:unnamed protein product [Rhizoctonia solani]|uniref:Uncharacterized protein n=1 Tax=Rhizoctonia solani TaxID=456999 RepID=A0A8H3D2X1_9AGAM|nr:unnamed protein product [Rhizoctonia solani]
MSHNPFSIKPDMRQNGRQVMEIPELLTIIAHELNAKERRELLSVSQCFFRSIGPMVWKRVPRLDLLLNVITDTKIDFSVAGTEWPYSQFTEITTTLPLKPDLSRYYIYAPWVQELEIFGGYSQEVFYAGPFLNLLCGNPPLPNLRRLTACTGADTRSRPMMNFFDMFMIPSLTEVRTIFNSKDHPTYTYPSLVAYFLDKVQKICPKIQVLELYPRTNDFYLSRPFTLSDHSCSAIQSFSNLRSFTSTSCVLKPKPLGVLGSLPYLESLSIRGFGMEDRTIDEQLSIPGDQFRRLVDLRLYGIHPQDINLLWGQPSLVKKLDFALIQTNPYIQLDDYWIESFLTALPNLSPNLRGLSFDTGNEIGMEYEISEDALNALDGLQLHRLVLKDFKIRFGNSDGDEDWESETDDDEN